MFSYYGIWKRFLESPHGMEKFKNGMLPVMCNISPMEKMFQVMEIPFGKISIPVMFMENRILQYLRW